MTHTINQNCLFMKSEWFFVLNSVSKFTYLTMLKVKICGILPKRKKKLRQIFYMLHSTWKPTRKSIKSLKNIGGKVSHFCLGSKTWLGCWDPTFNPCPKFSVLCSTFWQILMYVFWKQRIDPSDKIGSWLSFQNK